MHDGDLDAVVTEKRCSPFDECNVQACLAAVDWQEEFVVLIVDFDIFVPNLAGHAKQRWLTCLARQVDAIVVNEYVVVDSFCEARQANVEVAMKAVDDCNQHARKL